jgi:hypothetical protein
VPAGLRTFLRARFRGRAAVVACAGALLLAGACGRERTAPAAGPGGDAARAVAVDFRDRVLAIVGEEFPGETFETSVDPWVLHRGEAELHLENLKAKCDAAGGLGSCRGVVRNHFETILESLRTAAAPLPSTWAEAAPTIRPQIAPGEYRRELEMAHEPFGAGLIVAFVHDAEKSYRFVSRDDLERWAVDLATLRTAAFENLERASRDLPVAASDGDDRLLAIEVGDGYDATRLLLPGFRRFAAGKLGDPFLAAIPNRDVLVLWSKSASPAFQARVRAEVEKSFRGGAYPLTDRLFEAGAAGFAPLPE